MTALAAFRDGIRRVNGAPAILWGLVLVTLLVSLPLAMVVRGMIEVHLGPSATAALAAERGSYDWLEEFAAQASGIGRTLTPSVTGFAAVLDNAGGLLDNRPLAPTIIGVTTAWLVLWTFLSGGVLDRLARQRPTRSHGFFAACGTHFWRFLRLGLVAAVVYVVLFGAVHDWLFTAAYGRLTRDVTVERTAFAVRTGAYVVFSAGLAAFALLFDYARVRIVVEDRRSALGALVSAGRFLSRYRRRAAALFLLNAGALLALMALYAVAAPGALAGLRGWVALALGQTYIIGRHYLKLLMYASETALFQGTLAHAGYTAAPAVVWPESPAVETIENAGPQA